MITGRTTILRESWEYDYSDWTLVDPVGTATCAVVGPDPSLAFDGSNYLLASSFREFTVGPGGIEYGPWSSGSAYRSLDVIPGETYRATVWIYNSDANGYGRLRVLDGVTSTVLGSASGEDAWERVSGEFVAENGEVTLYLEQVPTSGLASFTYFDYLEVASVAIKLWETPVDALTTVLKSRLATELSAIEAERGDGLSLQVPASGDYYISEIKEATGPVIVEVLPAAFELADPYVDAGSNRATFEVEILIRVTFTNRNQFSGDEMERAACRYAAAIFRVLLNYPYLEGTDPAVQIVRPGNFERELDRDEDEDGVSKMRVTVSCVARCEEDNS